MLKKFREWMKFDPPYALDADGWSDFREKFRKEAPVRYFLTKTLGGRIRSIGWKVERVTEWVRYRTVSRNHIVKTGLEPGYNDVTNTMLYTNFTMLVEFVECEKAWMQIVFNKDLFKEHMGWKRHLPRILRPRFHSRELGLTYLDWEATLDGETVAYSERNPRQADSARKIKKLYLWWTDERPKREEFPYPLENEDEGRSDNPLRMLSTKWKNENPDKDAAIRDWSRKTHMQEEAWNAEDTVMLCELVKLRLSLWT